MSETIKLPCYARMDNSDSMCRCLGIHDRFNCNRWNATIRIHAPVTSLLCAVRASAYIYLRMASGPHKSVVFSLYTREGIHVSTGTAGYARGLLILDTSTGDSTNLFWHARYAFVSQVTAAIILQSSGLDHIVASRSTCYVD